MPLNYSNLEWRLETEVSSRTTRDQLKPYVTLKLELTDDTGHRRQVCLRCDLANLYHLTDALEEALSEARITPSRPNKALQ